MHPSVFLRWWKYSGIPKLSTIRIQKSRARHTYKVSCLLLPLQAILISQRVLLICGISVDNFASSFWSLNLKMADDDSLPWGTLQCAGKLAGHRLLSFYALILVFPVIWYFLFGSWFKSQLGSLVSGVKQLLHGLVLISRKKKRCSHCERLTKAKAKDRVRKWRR